jgi:hypothetical protein
VSVGGLLAFDHVLRKHWSSIGWSNMECPPGAEIARCHLFCGPRKGFIRVFVLGFMGCQPMGLPMIRHFCK